MKIWHNNRCSKSRCALEWLNENNFKPEVFDYLTSTLTKSDIQAVLKQLSIPANELLRSNEEEYKQHIKGKMLTEDEIIDLMLQFPKLIERPIVLGSKGAVVARPLEKLIEAINQNKL